MMHDVVNKFNKFTEQINYDDKSCTHLFSSMIHFTFDGNEFFSSSERLDQLIITQLVSHWYL